MKFSKKGRVGRIRFSLVIRTVKNVQGVTSLLDDGQHILMWDFDGQSIKDVERNLWAIQVFYELPDIHISQSSDNGGLHAYCLHRTPWLESLHIVAGTRGVDPDYVSLAAWRKKWTLRLSDKGQGAPTFLKSLPSLYPVTATVEELKSWVDYEVWAGMKPQVTE